LDDVFSDVTHLLPLHQRYQLSMQTTRTGHTAQQQYIQRHERQHVLVTLDTVGHRGDDLTHTQTGVVVYCQTLSNWRPTESTVEDSC